MVKKCKIVILTFMIALSLAACKGKEKVDDKKESKTTSQDVVLDKDTEKEKSEDTISENENSDTGNTVQDSWSSDTKNPSENKSETVIPSGDVPKAPEKTEPSKTPDKDTGTENSDYDYEDDEGWMPWV